MKIDELSKAIEAKKEEIKAKQKEIDNFELDVDDYVEQYEEMINETNETVKIGSLEYEPAYVLKEVDPTAYRCGLNDYVDSIDKTELTDYMDLEEELEELENELTDLENELEEKEGE
jgi:predicted  nucleic acid-binding Zn-ribbon protein